MIAASIIVFGTPCRAAMKMIMKKPVFFQTSMMMIDIEITPYDRDKGGGYNHRQEIRQAEQIQKERGHRAIEGEREQKSHAYVSRHREDREAQRIPKDLKRAIAGEEALKILQADPARTGHRIVVSEAQHEGNDDRRQHENRVQHKGRQDEKITGAHLRLREVGSGSRDPRLHRTCAQIKCVAVAAAERSVST